MKNYSSLLLLFIILVASTNTNATIYREVSSSGHVTFTDKSPYGHKLSLNEVSKTKYHTKISKVDKKNKWISPNIHDKRISSPDELHNLSADFDDAIFDNWLSSYWDCSNNFERVDLVHNNLFRIFTRYHPIVIPIVKRNNKSLELYYSEKIKYLYDNKQQVLLSYRNNKKFKVLYVCADQDVPQFYKEHYATYLINQKFLAGHGLGKNIEIKDGKKFLEQECRRAYESKEYDNARSTCGLAAANSKNMIANYYLGMLYRFNYGGDINLETSYKHTLAAANAGFSSAYSWLAWHYDFGKGVKKDIGKSLYWRIASVDAGHLKNAASVANHYMQGISVKKDYAQAAVWLTIAAKAGDSHAQNKLGCMYANGVGLKQNDKLAHHWILKSRRQNNLKAIFNLAVLYEQDRIVRDGKGYSISLYNHAKKYGITRSSDIIDKYDRIW